MSVVAAQGKASIKKFYTIGERLLAFNFNDEVAARVAGEFIGGMYFTPTSGRAAHFVDCTVEIFYGDPPPPLPPNCRSFEVPRGHCYTNGEEHFLDIDESRIAVSTDPARLVSVWLGTTEHARHPVAIINTLSYAVQAALRRCRLYVLHAAGVIEPETNTGLIVVGNSNSGKSSLTIRLASAGWRYLSDDMLVLGEAEGEVEAWPLRRVFSVSPESLAGGHLRELEAALGAPVNSDPSKRRLDPAIVFPGGFVGSCFPRVLLFPVLTGEQASRAENLTSGEAMARLIRQCPWASYDAGTAREHLRVLGLLAKQSASYLLHAGRDLIEDASSAPKLLKAACLEH
ncbi:MAG TPA: hypothetical protein VK363_08545 [Pyrinomonadaceae bacterium]|nr:hypothetical protein [Pyrinomonadaceae bacterium]